MPNNEIQHFDFEGFDEDWVMIHPEQGLLVHASKFIGWLGYDTGQMARVIRDNRLTKYLVKGVFRPASRVSSGGRAADAMMKRGAQILLLTSKHPRAIKYREDVMDVIEAIERDGFFISDGITPQQLLRLNERTEYLNLREVMKRSIDYDPSDEVTRNFFIMMQNRFHITITGMDAKELRDSRPINMAIVPPDQLTRKGEPNADAKKVGLNRYSNGEIERRHATDLIVIGMLKLRMAEFKDGYRMRDVIRSVNWALNQASSTGRNR